MPVCAQYVNEIPFLNMSMTVGPGRSYRYFTGTPLYPFGYGLSYTTFKLSWNPQPPAVATMVSATDATTYHVNVTNTGSRTGDEVVFAFFKPDASSITTRGSAPTPIKQLFAFERVTLEPGQTVELAFTVPASKLALVDAEGHRSLHAGQYDVTFSRGHGEELATRVVVDVSEPVRQFTFKAWW